MQLGCIHSYINSTDDSVVCGKPLPRWFRQIAIHGWLCVSHYREQQREMKGKPRKPLIGDDTSLVQSILKTESEAIAKGALEPVWHAGTRITFWRAA